MPQSGSNSGGEEQRIVRRWQAYDGELRANVLRVVCVLTFYAIHSGNFFFGQAMLPEVHRQMTLLAVSGILVALAIALCLRFCFFPQWLMYAATALDVALVSVALLLVRGPQSSLVVAFYLVIALAGLRLQLPLVWFTTAATIVGYLVVLGGSHPDWFGGQRDFRIARYEEVIFASGLILMGVIVGQTVRRSGALTDAWQRLEGTV